ncbi:DUF4388 domain-containing protein [Actinoplanes palleronii]|uniref:DUF5666 domain-containing protein n=1 Tax=Actinoplanes palleronii TaxID=113570 RepID=A0ABQ4BSN3_9ACTN|nr:DUF4388 domain-containing protein [Actinoplanes palleronii]GIE73694.1 hypothetical protein Apa02nite_098020 [Actinoplanes palleronii]
MIRTGKALVVAATATLALAGCGAAAVSEKEIDPETVALQAVGFVTDEETTATTDRVRPKVVRQLLRHNALHGEVTVQAKDGEKTVVVQRGKITAVTDKGLTVESTDGFTLTWTYGDPLRVVQQRKKVERDTLKTGTEIGVGGVESGSATAARLIVVKKPK